MNITVKRFDPSVDAAPYEVSYDVPWRERITALEALVWIYENADPIAFDYGCHARTCGRCAMLIDGNPELACITVLSDGDHVIEPLPTFPVVRDLVVDKTQKHREVSQHYERVRFDELDQAELNAFENMEHDEDMLHMEYCTRCGRCTSVCPAYNTPGSSYVGPMTMLANVYRHYDSFDQSDRVLQAVSEGIFDCILCGRCTEVCNANEIEHVKYWEDLRNAAAERGMVPRSAQ